MTYHGASRCRSMSLSVATTKVEGPRPPRLRAIDGFGAAPPMLSVCDDLYTELGGEPEGEHTLIEVVREGSESTEPRKWKVSQPSACPAIAASGSGCRPTNPHQPSMPFYGAVFREAGTVVFRTRFLPAGRGLQPLPRGHGEARLRRARPRVPDALHADGPPGDRPLRRRLLARPGAAAAPHDHRGQRRARRHRPGPHRRERGAARAAGGLRLHADAEHPAARRGLPGDRHLAGRRRRDALRGMAAHALPRQGHDVHRQLPGRHGGDAAARAELRLQLADRVRLRRAAEGACGQHAQDGGTLRQQHPHRYNPSPDREVFWGEQSWDEMFFIFTKYTIDKEDLGN